jgi:hypothetical protein
MRRYARSTRDRVIEGIKVVDNGYLTPCYMWQGETDRNGYGRIKHNGRYVGTHWVLKGDVRLDFRPPKGMEVDHLCRNYGCCRPSHLEYVTRLVNMERMHEARREKE